MKQNVHLLKVCLSHTVIIFVSFLLSFDYVGICFILHPIPRKEHQIPSRSPYHPFLDGQIWVYQVNHLLDTIRLGSPITPACIWVVTYICARILTYDLSSNIVAFRTLLPTTIYNDAFFRSSRSLTNTNLSLTLNIVGDYNID